MVIGSTSYKTYTSRALPFLFLFISTIWYNALILVLPTSGVYMRVSNAFAILELVGYLYLPTVVVRLES